MKRFLASTAVSIAVSLPAAALAEFSTVQFGYSDPEDGNVVAVVWDQTTAGQVRFLFDGELIGTAEGAAGTNIVSVTDVPEGIHTFEVFQGDTSLGGLSQEVISSQPTPAIALECRQSDNPDDCEIVVTGSSGGPPVTRVDIFVDGVFAGSRVEEFIESFHVEVTAPVTASGPHEATAQWTIERGDDSNYSLLGSFVSIASTSCSTTCGLTSGARYTPGVCNGSGATPDISSPIFGLGALFGGGAQPPCRKACDANDDGQVDIADMIYVLNFLFSGGPAPRAWTDRTGDAVPDPACVTAAPADDCAESHASCAP